MKIPYKIFIQPEIDENTAFLVYGRDSNEDYNCISVDISEKKKSRKRFPYLDLSRAYLEKDCSEAGRDITSKVFDMMEDSGYDVSVFGRAAKSLDDIMDIDPAEFENLTRKRGRMEESLDLSDIESSLSLSDIRRNYLNSRKGCSSIRKIHTWNPGTIRERKFDRYTEDVIPMDLHRDTNEYLSSLDLGNDHPRDDERSFLFEKNDSSRMREGAGAGYDFILKNVSLVNVKILGIDEEEGIQSAEFKADIVPGTYVYHAEGYDWSVDNGYVDVEKGTVYGTCENIIQAYSDASVEYSEDDFISDIEGETYDIGDMIGGGYIHSDMKSPIELTKDFSDERSGYKDSFITYAEVHMKVDDVNMDIHDAMDRDMYEDEEDEEDEEPMEESLDRGEYFKSLRRAVSADSSR